MAGAIAMPTWWCKTFIHVKHSLNAVKDMCISLSSPLLFLLLALGSGDKVLSWKVGMHAESFASLADENTPRALSG